MRGCVGNGVHTWGAVLVMECVHVRGGQCW